MYSGLNHLNTLGNSKKPGLNKLARVLGRLNNPETKLNNNIIITGTNGKGSVATQLSKILVKSKYNVGLYTSPHLIDINERIRINNKKILLKDLDKALKIIIKESVACSIELSFFELLTAASIYHFAKSNTDINIFEVGLGGKHDATNIVDAQIGIITNIAKDHMEYLGNTITKIAKEKAGIIRKGSHLITTAEKRGLRIITEECKMKSSKISVYNKDFFFIKKKDKFQFESPTLKLEFKSSWNKYHQIKNMSLVIKSLDILQNQFHFKVPSQNIVSILKNPYVPGRFQIISNEPLKVVDVAHNIAAIKNLVSNLKETLSNRKIDIIVGMLKDKKPIECIRILSEISRVIYLTDVPNERSFNPSKIIKEFNNNNKIQLLPSELIKEKVMSKDPLLVTGSIYLIGDLMKKKIIQL